MIVIAKGGKYSKGGIEFEIADQLRGFPFHAVECSSDLSQIIVLAGFMFEDHAQRFVDSYDS